MMHEPEQEKKIGRPRKNGNLAAPIVTRLPEEWDAKLRELLSRTYESPASYIRRATIAALEKEKL